jgi:hypothetical protein
LPFDRDISGTQTYIDAQILIFKPEEKSLIHRGYIKGREGKPKDLVKILGPVFQLLIQAERPNDKKSSQGD